MVEELFRADENGEIFKSNQNEIMSTIDRELAVDRELLKLFEAQKYVKSIETNVELLKEQLLIEMENNGIRTYETDNYAITRVQESVGVKYDNARLYSDFRTMGGDTDEYKIATTRKAHLRITDKRPKGV